MIQIREYNIKNDAAAVLPIKKYLVKTRPPKKNQSNQNRGTTKEPKNVKKNTKL